jgi:hypothetical protein
LIDVLDETGARPSQVVRLTAGDLQGDFVDRRTGKRQLRLMMPTSHKGRGRKQVRFIPTPITAALAARLKGRADTSGTLLLTQPNGTPWSETNLTNYGR